MRYTPFGSASINFSDSASLSQFAITASRALRTDLALYAISSSKGPDGDPADPCLPPDGPYGSYPPFYI
jgi:hypothetical protein